MTTPETAVAPLTLSFMSANYVSAALGYGAADVTALAEGAYAQQRPLVMAPRSVSIEDLQGLYRDALRYW